MFSKKLDASKTDYERQGLIKGLLNQKSISNCADCQLNDLRWKGLGP